MSTISEYIQRIDMIDFRPEIILGKSNITGNNYNGISLLKGILISLVVIGHLIPGGFYSNIAAYLIYSFHMPLFLGLSGYLCNSTFLKSCSFQELWSKYTKRMLFLWAIAWIVYGLMEVFVARRFTTTSDLMDYLIFPDMHLWYVPALIVYINVLYILKKFEWPDWKILLLSFVISIIFVNLFETTRFWNVPGNTVEEHLYYTYRPHYFFFFVLGYAIKSFKFEKKTANFLKMLLTCLIIFRLLNFYYSPGPHILVTWDFYFINMILLSLILPYFQENKKFEYSMKKSLLIRKIYSIFMWMGINSLYIYLWHGLLRYIQFI